MKDEMYSFDKIDNFSVIVIKINNKIYEGIAFLYAHQNPHFEMIGEDPEEIRNCLINSVMNCLGEQP